MADAGLGWVTIKGKSAEFEAAKYCSDEGAAIRCTREVAGPWERFRIYDMGVGKVAIRGGKNELYCADEGTHIECNRNEISTLALFELSCLENCGSSSGFAVSAPATGKVTLPAGLSTGIAGTPTYLSACFIPAGTISELLVGENCPVDSPNANANPNGGLCTDKLLNAVRLQA